MLLAEYAEGDDSIVIDERITALIILDGDFHQIVERAHITDVVLVTARETAPWTRTADEFETAVAVDILAQRLGMTYFHAAFFKVQTHQMRWNARVVQAL